MKRAAGTGLSLWLLLALVTAGSAAAQDAGLPEEGTPEGATGDEGAATSGAPVEGDAPPAEDGSDASAPTDAPTPASGGGTTTSPPPTSAPPTSTPPPATGTSGSGGSDTPMSGGTTGSSSDYTPTGERRPPTHYGAAPRTGDDEDEAEEDEGDPYDFLWIELFGGFSYVDLRAIETNNYYPESVRLSGSGPAGGVAAGFRIEFFSVGVRGAYAYYDDGFEVGTALAEIKLHIPIPIVRPFLRVGFGLGWHGDTDTDFEALSPPSNAQTTVFGWAFNAAVGVDIYFAHWFSIGAAINGDVLNMSRQAWEDPAGDPGDVSFEDSGDAVGIQLRGQLAVTFHL